MTTRLLLAVSLAVPFLGSTAVAQEVVPLQKAKGENIDPVARVLIPGANEVELAGDWAFVSQDAVGDTLGGLTIVNIADPAKPYVQARWNGADGGLTDASFGDVDLSPDGNLAALTNAHCDDCAEGEVPWVVLLDVSDKSNPRLVGKIIDDDTMDYVHTSTIDNKMLYLNPQVAAFYPQAPNAHITAFDISDPSAPRKVGTISGPGSDLGLAHDSYVDHRPDGKTLMYAASVSKIDVFDISDPLKASWLQTSASPQYTIAHDVQPNFDRSIIVVDDEGAAGGQLDERVSVCGKAGTGPASVNSGSLQFYEAAPDGTFAKGGLNPVGTFNAPTNVNTGACVAHVFWQAPDENRLTQAYYRTGAFIVDFEDPANPKMLGWFLPEGGAMYWSNKPHRGYLYATDMKSGLDILRYTGEGGTRWPATAGPAEVQRAARQGVPYVPIAGVQGSATTPATAAPAAPAATPAAAPVSGSQTQPGASTGARKLGAFQFRVKLERVPGRAGTRTALALTFKDKAGRTVSRVKLRRKAGTTAVLKLRGVALAGRYRWSLAAGQRTLRRGTVRSTPRDGLTLSPGKTLAVSVRSPRG